MTPIQCKNGHGMELRDVHLATVNPTTSYGPRFQTMLGLKLVKDYECLECGDTKQVNEEAR